MKQLFDYQEKIIADVTKSFEDYQTALLISLMGTGKTVMASALIRQYVYSSKRVLFLVDLNCLLGQISKELWEWKVPYSVLQGERNTDYTMPVIIASIQTIDARIRNKEINIGEWLGHFDLIIIDEAHNLSYRKAMEDLRNFYNPKGTKFLGMTATPWRMNPEEYLGQFYKKVVVGMQPPDLIKIGRAVPCRIFHFDDYFDLNKIAKGVDGDYLDSDIEKQAISTAQLNKVYSEWQFRTPNEKSIAFCSTVNHAKLLAEYFSSKGVKSAYIHAKTSDKEREELFKQLKDGDLIMLASVNTLTAGFDCPNVSCILYVRVTESKSAYFQAAGRGARCYPGKEYFTILDFGNCCEKHGSPMTYQDYSIAQKGFRKERTKICPDCHSSMSMFARICPECGYEFKSKSDETDSPEFEELELDIPMVEYFCKEDVERLNFFRSEKKRCYFERSHPDTAKTLFFEKYGYQAPFDWGYQAVFGASATKQDMDGFVSYLKAFAPHDFWVKMQVKAEFGDFGAKRQTKQKKKAALPKHNFTTTVAWYQVLGVSRYADPAEIKSAYRKLARQWHPDVCQDASAETKMKELNWAYEQFEKECA